MGSKTVGCAMGEMFIGTSTLPYHKVLHNVKYGHLLVKGAGGKSTLEMELDEGGRRAT